MGGGLINERKIAFPHNKIVSITTLSETENNRT